MSRGADRVRDAYAQCESLVRELDKERFLASLFVPADRRPHVLALYAFNAEIARVRDVAHEPLPGEIRLQWWRDALAGQGQGEVSANPVAAALIDTVERFALPRETLHGLIDAHTFDLYDEPMPTVAELEEYARKTSAAIISLAAHVLDDVDADLEHGIELGGIALGIAGILRAFPKQIARGQVFLPLDLLKRHDIDPAHLSTQAPATLSAALADLRQHASSRLMESRFEELAAGTLAASAVLPIALASPLLDRLRRQHREPLAVIDLPQWRAQWALWRAARRMR